MKQLEKSEKGVDIMFKRASMLFFYFCVILNMGCGEDSTETIQQMVIEEVDIQIYPIDTVPHLLQESLRSRSESFSEEDKFYLLFVFIIGSYGGCDYYHETRAPRSSDGIVLWRNGDTITIDVTAVNVEGNVVCPDAIFNHRETVFAGFCSPGQYILNVNDIQKQFTVGNL